MTEERTLSTHFNDLWKKYSSIEDLPNENQQQLNECIAQARHLMASVEQLDLYSENEDFEEIATSDIKFLLLPALLGWFNEYFLIKFWECLITFLFSCLCGFLNLIFLFVNWILLRIVKFLKLNVASQLILEFIN